MQKALRVVTRSVEETRIIGASLAPQLVPGDVISLGGDLGAGKTALVQGIAAALGVRQRVTSPSFTIVHEYEARFPLIHLDVYRLNSIQEVLDLGFEEFLDPDSVVIIEWGEAIAPLLPQKFLDLELQRPADLDANETERILTFWPRGREWVRKIQAMRDTAETLLDAVAAETSESPRFEVVTGRLARDHMGAEDKGIAGEG